MDTDTLIAELAEKGARKPMPGLLLQLSAWLAAAWLWMGAVVFLAGLRPDIAGRLAEPFYLAELALLAVLGGTAALAALAFSRPDDCQMPWVRFIPLSFAAVWPVAAFLNMDPVAVSSLAGDSLHSARFDCVRCILELSLPPGIAMFLIVRTGVAIRVLWAGGMAAAAAATFAYLAMRLIEPSDSPAHLLLWHALPVAVLCLAGMAAGKLFLRWNRSLPSAAAPDKSQTG